MTTDSSATPGAVDTIPFCPPAQPCSHWYCDVRNTLAALLATTTLQGSSQDEWADACAQRTIAAHSLPLPPIPPSLIQLLRAAFIALDPKLADAIANGASDYYPVSTLTDAILDADWALHDGMISVRQNEADEGREVVVLGPELQVLEMIEAASRLDDIEIPLDLAISKHLVLPPYIDEPLLPATATFTTRIPRFKPIPTLQDMATRMRPLHTLPEKGFSCAFADVGGRAGMTVTRDVLDVLEAVLDPFGGLGEVEWMARVIGDSFDAKNRSTRELDPPLFAMRNDPATLPPAAFSSSSSALSARADNDDRTFRALIAGMKQVDSSMSLPCGDGDDGVDGRHQQHDHVVPDSVARVLAEPLLTLRNDSDTEDTNLHLLADYSTHTSPHLAPFPTTPPTPTTPSSKRKRILQPLSPPIFTAAKDNGVSDNDDARYAKRSRAGILSPLTVSTAVEFAMRVSGGGDGGDGDGFGKKVGGGEEVGVDVPVTLDEELERFFDFHAAASADAGIGGVANGVKGALEGILDETWDVAATKTIKVPTLPPPAPFHAHADPWPSFRALLIRELGVRALDASTSSSVSSRGAEAALMSWDPISALRRAVGGVEEGGWGSARVWRRRVLRDEDWVECDGVDAKLVGMKVGEMMVDVRECISLAPREDEAEDSFLITGVVVRDKTHAAPPPMSLMSPEQQPPRAGDDTTPDLSAAAACEQNTADWQPTICSTSSYGQLSPAAVGTYQDGGEDMSSAADYFDQDNCHEALLDAAAEAAAAAQVEVEREEVEHITPLVERSALDQFLMLRGKASVIATRTRAKIPRTPRMPATAAGVFAPPPPIVVAARECIPPSPPLPLTISRRRLTCVAGPALMTRGQLVRCLERDYAVDLVEWDAVAGLESQYPTDADLVVDGHTAIIYRPLSYISTLAPSATAPPTLKTLFHTTLGRALLCCSIAYPRVRIVLIDDDDDNRRTTTKVFPPATVRGLRAVTALASVLSALGEVEIVLFDYRAVKIDALFDYKSELQEGDEIDFDHFFCTVDVPVDNAVVVMPPEPLEPRSRRARSPVVLTTPARPPPTRFCGSPSSSLRKPLSLTLTPRAIAAAAAAPATTPPGSSDEEHDDDESEHSRNTLHTPLRKSHAASHVLPSGRGKWSWASPGPKVAPTQTDDVITRPVGGKRARRSGVADGDDEDVSSDVGAGRSTDVKRRRKRLVEDERHLLGDDEEDADNAVHVDYNRADHLRSADRGRRPRPPATAAGAGSNDTARLSPRIKHGKPPASPPSHAPSSSSAKRRRAFQPPATITTTTITTTPRKKQQHAVPHTDRDLMDMFSLTARTATPEDPTPTSPRASFPSSPAANVSNIAPAAEESRRHRSASGVNAAVKKRTADELLDLFGESDDEGRGVGSDEEEEEEEEEEEDEPLSRPTR
ncbi:hypothetical protein HDU87_008684 [Geranomyces variabilis]|uniref:Uncharacterized protein n=1 Tax=Geranomyces variabilis TaxID=109894 RepID=A0AAD5XIX7_9FUNG|nr:hypothetical protein HDU87_008684 [Geranomyces variabilis]